MKRERREVEQVLPQEESTHGKPHAACTMTLVDRLVHRSEIIEVDGDSYRLKEAKERAAQRTASRKSKKDRPLT